MSHAYTFSSISALFDAAPSQVMQTIMQTIRHIAVSDLGVLIVGEDGTEKEWLARMIHDYSGRTEGKFIHFDSSRSRQDAMERTLFGSEELLMDGVAIHRGVLEESSNGTLLIDQVSNLSAMLQMKLAHIMEYQHFHRVGGYEQLQANVRMITTLNKKPGDMIVEGNFGKEIYYRMCPVIINLPPLRERREDILFLIKKFVVEFSQHHQIYPKGITAGALQSCLTYDWPGNAKEVKSVIGHAMGSCSDRCIRKIDLPVYLQKYSLPRENVTDAEIVNG